MNQTNYPSQRHKIALAVGVYDTAVGLFPLLSMSTFHSFTNLVSHDLIVRSIGAAWAGLGIALLASSNNQKIIPILGVASTVAGGTLALAELALVATGKISPIFLVQAACETIIGATWMMSLLTKKQRVAIGATEPRETAASSR